MEDKRKIFITITLYLLLALTFFSDYFVEGKTISSVGALMFLVGIVTLIPLTIIYINDKYKPFWAWFWMIPFISLILFNLTLLYGKALNVGTEGGLVGFVQMGGRIFGKFICMDSLTIILISMLIFLIVIKKRRN